MPRTQTKRGPQRDCKWRKQSIKIFFKHVCLTLKGKLPMWESILVALKFLHKFGLDWWKRPRETHNRGSFLSLLESHWKLYCKMELFSRKSLLLRCYPKFLELTLLNWMQQPQQAILTWSFHQRVSRHFWTPNRTEQKLNLFGQIQRLLYNFSMITKRIRNAMIRCAMNNDQNIS